MRFPARSSKSRLKTSSAGLIVIETVSVAWKHGA